MSFNMTLLPDTKRRMLLHINSVHDLAAKRLECYGDDMENKRVLTEVENKLMKALKYCRHLQRNPTATFTLVGDE